MGTLPLKHAGEPPDILVVEDEMLTSKMVQVILEQNGFKVRCAFTFAAAMEQLKTALPALILLDISLPDGNGFDICEYLQKESGMSRIPVLFMSSHEDVETKIRGFEVGGVDYITKPVAGAELIARATTHLRLRRAYDQLAELQAERIQHLAGAQEALMPLPEDLPAAKFSIHLNQILSAGGDFYDVVPVSQKVTDYIVADASGHDLAASFWTAALKTVISQNARPENNPRDIVHSINKILKRILPDGVFFTLLYLRVNRSKNRVTLISAAHPPVLILPADGTDIKQIDQQGDVIGMFDDAVFGRQVLDLRPGDRLLIYSDGLIEMEPDHEQGLLSLHRLVGRLRDLPLEQLVDQLVAEAGRGKTIEDDIVLMGVEL